MKAYFIIQVNVKDFEKYQQYIQSALPTIIKHQGKVLIADSSIKQLEGTFSGNLQVVIEFPSEENALNWYNDDEYKKVKHLRHEAAETISLGLTKELIIQ